MPSLFSLGQHVALQAVQRLLVEGERLFAFLDDVHVTTPNPDRVGPIHRVLDAELYRHARIRINGGKTPVWNSFGIRREFCVGTRSGPRCPRLAGSDVPEAQQGVTVLGTPLGRAEFVHAQLNQKLADHDTLLSSIPLVADVQSAWALLLHCAGARANHILRVVRPELVRDFATMRGCGDVWHASSRQVWEPMEQRKQQHPCLWPWTGWVCAMRLALVSLLFGPAGLTVCPWSMTDTQMWPR